MNFTDSLHVIATAGFWAGAVYAWAGARGVLIYAASVALGAAAHWLAGWRGVAVAAVITAVMAVAA